MIPASKEKQLTIEAKFFKGLADKSRLSILETLVDSEKSVSEIVAVTNLSQSNTSMHLACLLDCGLVRKEQQGRQVQYRIAESEVKELVDLMRVIVGKHTQEIYDCTHNYEDKDREER